MSADHERIRAVLARYCRGIDRRDETLVRSCFLPDATDDHGTGPRPLEQFVEWCFDLLARYDMTFHLLGQSLVEPLGPDEARVETYGIAHHRRVGGPDHLNLVSGFRYLDLDWSRVDPEAAWWPVPPHLLVGRPGSDDPSFD